MAKKSLIEVLVTSIARGIFRKWMRRKVTGNPTPFTMKDAISSTKNTVINFIVTQAWKLVGLAAVYGAMIVAQKFL